MHSRIFQMTKDVTDIETQIECVEDSDSIFEMMKGIADYVSESDDTISDDLKWLFTGLIGNYLYKEHKTEDGDSYIEIPYSTIRMYIENWRKKKLETMKKVMSENIPNIINYLETGKLNEKKNISMEMYNVKTAIEDRFDFYIYDTDYGIMTVDSAICDYFETVEKDKSVYVIKSFDYHF